MFRKGSQARAVSPGIYEVEVSRMTHEGREIDPRALAEKVWALREHMDACNRLEPHRIVVQLTHGRIPGLNKTISTVHLSGEVRGQRIWSAPSTTRAIGFYEILWVRPELGDRLGQLTVGSTGVTYQVNTNPAPSGWSGF